MDNLQELRELIIKQDSRLAWTDLQLHHVLITLGKLEINWYNTFNDKTINILGYSLEDPNVVVVDLIWDLTKDLDNQSEEVIVALLKLIKEK